MKKLKIAITLPENRRGGPFISQSRIMNSSLQVNYDFFPIYIPRIRALINPKRFFKIVKEIKKSSPDIFHFYGLQMDGFFSLLLLKFASKNIPTVLAVRGSSDEAVRFNFILRFIVRLMELYTLKHSNIIYGVSEYVSNWKKIKECKTKYYGHIYNFLPEISSKDEKNADIIRDRLGINKSDFVVISTGRIEIEKGYADLQKVINYDDYGNNVVFLIVGDGRYLNEMKMTTDLKNSKIVFTKHVNDVFSLLRISDLFITLSWHETLGNSIIEALQIGIPCIATRVGGIPELIVSELNGQLVEKGDYEQTNIVLKHLILNNKDLFDSDTIKKDIETKIDNERIKFQIEDIYNRAVKTNSSY